MPSRIPTLIALAGCLAAAAPAAAGQAEFDQAYEAAVAARQKAASVGGEWRDIGALLKEAKALAESGDFKAAVKLAQRAGQQGRRGYEQMVSQAGKVGPEPFFQ